MTEQLPPRIPTVDAASAELQETLSKTLSDPTGKPLNIFTTLAQHPRLLKRFNVFAGTFLAHGSLPARDREIVVLRVAWRCSAAYEWGQHVLIGRDAGVTETEIVRLAQNSLEGWADRDYTLLTFADEVLRDVDVSDSTWTNASARLENAELVELLMLVGLYRMVAGFLNAARVASEPYLPSWPDEGELPET